MSKKNMEISAAMAEFARRDLTWRMPPILARVNAQDTVRTQGVYAYNQTFVGDLECTKLYRLSTDIYDEDGLILARRRRTPHIHDNMQNVRYKSLTIDMETGMGTAVPQGVNPVVMMLYSDDCGRSWSGEIREMAGVQGDYKARVKFDELNFETRDLVFEITMSDPVRWTIVGAELEAEGARGGQ